MGRGVWGREKSLEKGKKRHGAVEDQERQKPGTRVESLAVQGCGGSSKELGLYPESSERPRGGNSSCAETEIVLMSRQRPDAR